MSDQEKRKFINPTPGWVGCTIINDEGKKEGFAVEPGNAVWLSEAEERATAEATRKPEDNPFVKTWEEPGGFHPENGSPLPGKLRTGTLIPSDEPPRPISSDRYTPSQAEAAARAASPEPTPETPPAAPPEREEEITGDDGVPEHTGPAPEGKPEPDEIVGTPEAAAANDAELAARAKREEEPTPVGQGDRPAGTDAIRTPPKAAPLPV